MKIDDFSMGAVLEMLVLKPPAAIRTISVRLADLREVGTLLHADWDHLVPGEPS